MTIANVSIKKLTNFISQEIRPDLIRGSLMLTGVELCLANACLFHEYLHSR